MLSIASSNRRLTCVSPCHSAARTQDAGKATQRNAHPVRTIVELVAQFVERLLEKQELEHAAAVAARQREAGCARDLLVTLQERLLGLRLPLATGALEKRLRVGAFRPEPGERCIHRVVKRPKHAGDILERRLLLFPLRERPR